MNDSQIFANDGEKIETAIALIEEARDTLDIVRFHDDISEVIKILKSMRPKS